MRKKVLVIPSYLRDRPRPWLVAAALLVCRSCEQVDHNAQCLSELIERALPDDRGHPTLDIANDLVRKPHDLSPTLGRDDELRSPVDLFGPTLHVPERLEFIHDPTDDLLVSPRAPREFGRASAFFVKMGDDGTVEMGQLFMAGFPQLRVELVVDREEKLRGQDSEAGLSPLLSWPWSRGRHELE